ncbi:MAG: WYL domain-containing protein [Clostridia bacterium]|nr:WYL domain-containing protein [Clostridia bacterium]
MANKNRMLFLLKYLQQHSDDEHPLTTADLTKALHKQGYDIKLSTLKNDIDTLKDAGYEIDVQQPAGLPKTYAWVDRAWSAPELQILIDAVSSSQFLTTEKSKEIIERLVKLAPPFKQDTLKPSILVSELVKAKNNQIFLIVQTIKEATERNKKIVFRYFRYNTDKQQTLRHDGKKYVISPYATIWKNDRYYLVGYSEEKEKILTFRIDRMTQVFIAGEEQNKKGKPLPEEDQEKDTTRIPPKDDFDLHDYGTKIFFMFNGEETNVTLRVKNDRIDQIIDTFGKDIELTRKTPNTFDITVPVCLSPTFFSWLFQYAGEIMIVKPEKARNWYTSMLETALDDALGG